MRQTYSAERVSPSEGGYVIHDEAGFEGMRRAGRLAAETLDMITPEVKPGVTTEYLNKLCHDFIEARGAIPAPLNYRGFPKSLCTSVNHVVRSEQHTSELQSIIRHSYDVSCLKQKINHAIPQII